MKLTSLFEIFSRLGCRKIYVKKLAPNDNSKNQVYLGGNFEVINILPIKDITTDNSGNWNSDRFKSKIDFTWIQNDGSQINAPDSQLILYPKYPEVRFSGFLKNASGEHSALMASRIEGRLLFLGVSDQGKIFGYVTIQESETGVAFNKIKDLPEVAVFKEISLKNGIITIDSRTSLLNELKRIHLLGWIDAKRLDKNKNILSCSSSNCGGYTLEAELGITPNGFAEPDYLGWEVKQFNVEKFSQFNSKVITLMTPEPTHGYYVSDGVEAFIRKYGYLDKMGRESRINFGGIHKFGIVQSTTQLTLRISGYDFDSNKMTNANGYIALVDKDDNIAASWSFSSLIKHWNTKHSNACYVPSMKRKHDYLYGDSKQQYYYGDLVILGVSTDFSLYLSQIINGNLYYDPGIKLELAIDGVRKQNIKRRSQFRIKSGNLLNLYHKNEVVKL